MYGSTIWIDVKYEICKEERCLIFCKRLDWQEKEDENYYSCDVNKPISEVTEDDISACKAQARSCYEPN
jgi:hypothetical protein